MATETVHGTDGTPGLPGIWKRMGEERRLQAATAFYQDPTQGENRTGMDAIIAHLRKFRPQFIKKLPLEKRAHYAATLPLPVEAMAQLIIAYHFHSQRPMMTEFLNALNIPNENGQIKSEEELPAPEMNSLQSAVETILKNHDREDTYIYLATLHVQGTTTWNGLTAILNAWPESVH